jgi:hypothetical protein
VPKARKLLSATSSSPTPGGFRLNGSWDERGQRNTPIMQFILSLRSDRKHTTMTPQEAVSRIPQPFLRAFPSAFQWAECDCWYRAGCQTSAESTVKYAFTLVNGSIDVDPDREWTDESMFVDPREILYDVVRSLTPKPPERKLLVTPRPVQGGPNG